MKPIRLIPKKTSKGWQLSIPAGLSTTGKRQRQYFTSRDKAEAVAAPLREKYRAGDLAASVLPKIEGEAAGKALAMLAEKNLSPLLLIEAAEQLLAKRDLAGRSVTFKAACEAYVAERSKGKRTSSYLEDYRRLVERFPEFASKLLCDIAKADIRATLAPLPASSHNLALREIRAIFNYGIKEGWCTDNPAGSIDPEDAGRPKIPTLTAKQLRRLFTAAIRLHPGLVPLLAVQTFAGVRPIESIKLTWDNLDLEEEDEKVLTVPDEVAKIRSARHIAMHPQLVAWIAWHKAQGEGTNEGTLCPARYLKRPERKAKKAKRGQDSTMPEALRLALREIRAKAKIVPWPQDGLRHTFASAALASGWRDVGGVCLDLGHTDQKMLHKHYHRAMRKAEALRVFAVAPPKKVNGAGKIVRLSAA